MRFSREAQRGFSLIEIAIATAIFALSLGLAVAAFRTSVRSAQTLDVSGASGLENTAALLRDLAGASAGVAAPSALNAGAYGPVAVLFYATDDRGNVSYAGLSQAGSTVYRVDFGNALSNPPVARPLAGINAISALQMAAAALPSSRYAPAFAGLSGPAGYDVPFQPAGGTNSAVSGGNHIVEVTIANGRRSRTLDLVPGVFPSGFTVRGAPLVHAVVYRIDSVICYDPFCWVHRTVGDIKGRVSVSYDGGTRWTIWCDGILIHPRVYVGPGCETSSPDCRYNLLDAHEKTHWLLSQCLAATPRLPPP
jgi:prepilin-type N-terminal cleavage/methylation domain-containing protein